jgi:hypothetical protein
LFPESIIDTEIIQAYRETHFHVHGDTPFTLAIDIASSALLALHATHQVTSSAFITACNPFSQAYVESDNVDRQRALSSDLHQRNLTCIDGIGQHPSNQWPGEQSFLVLGVSLEDANILGAKYKQNAIVWNGPDGVPQLILLR